MTLNQREDLGIWRSMKVEKLIELLKHLPPDYNVVTNRIGLTFLKGDVGDEDNWKPTHYIDVSAESLHKFSSWDED